MRVCLVDTDDDGRSSAAKQDTPIVLVGSRQSVSYRRNLVPADARHGHSKTTRGRQNEEEELGDEDSEVEEDDDDEEEDEWEDEDEGDEGSKHNAVTLIQLN
ncbi:hypothetical protein SeMB42_g00389 [Synchytrium endobioticum]|uniref:Uncharacterized protein n=1 Tax=Synchytrium endobioticum TaxID=286115 RepID=A0A507DSE7_9FUNG|nr:hypothetical protein SeMB42_g00389 [Synchytrium endobioticum]